MPSSVGRITSLQTVWCYQAI